MLSGATLAKRLADARASVHYTFRRGSYWSAGVVRAAISVTGAAATTATPAAPCSLLLALETFETVSGATHLYLSEPRKVRANP